MEKDAVFDPVRKPHIVPVAVTDKLDWKALVNVFVIEFVLLTELLLQYCTWLDAPGGT